MPRGKNNNTYLDLYLEFNRKYFNNELTTELIISESSRLKRSAALCYFEVLKGNILKPFEISLSRLYLNNFPDDLSDILLHEMIHIKTKNTEHKNLFLKEVERLKETFGVVVPLVAKSLNSQNIEN